MNQYKNIKDQISKIKNAIKKSNIFAFCFVILLFAFCFLNLIISQTISPIYFKFVSNEKASMISFLQKIKTLPEYQNILEMNNNIYGDSVKQEILRQENKKKEIIKNLEQQLTVNPKTRDVLYSLYQLTQDKNYLKQAREVDPGIN